MVESSDLVSALQRHFSFPRFRPGQRQAVENILNGIDTLVVMPTGHGKSLVYQLAAQLLPNTSLVISPLVSLMKDQVDKLLEYGIAATNINSALSSAEQAERLGILAEGGYKIVLVAPERLRNQKFRQALSRVPLSLLVVDEAHCLSQWGHDFRPDYLHIVDARQQFDAPVTLALTATATRLVQDEIRRLLGLPDMARIITGFNRPNLSFEVFYVPDVTAKLNTLNEFLANNGNAGIIYTGTRRDAEEVAEFAREVHGLSVSYYHAGLDADTRNKVQDLFMAGDLNLVTATNAFGMGIDRPDLRFVLHYTMPGSLEAYYQETGRAGRDGLSARSVLLYSPQDRALHEYFIESASPTVSELRLVHECLTALNVSPAGETLIKCVFRMDDLTSATGLPEVKIRVALEQLETSGALVHMSYKAGSLIQTRLGKLDDARLKKVSVQVESRRQHKHALLSKMVKYAETNNCRRRIILEYFGDSAAAEAPNCCDNCLSKNEMEQTNWQPAQTQSERATLVVLDTIARLRWGLGKSKIARILSGSSAKSVARFTRHRHYGMLTALRIKEIETLITQLVRGGYIKAVGSDKPTLALTSKGEMALKKRAAITLESLPMELPPKRQLSSQQQKAEQAAGDTVTLTGEMLADGLSPSQIAAERGLSERTIYSHLSRLIADGKVHVDDVVPVDQQRLIRAAIAAVGSVERLAPIKAQLPEEIDYTVIRCVAADWKFKNKGLDQDDLFERLRAWRLEKARDIEKPAFVIFYDKILRCIASSNPKTSEDLLEIHGISPAKVDQYGIEVLAIVHEYQKSISNDDKDIDPITAFLSRPHPRPLQGPWLTGWALDFHSRFVGSDQVRGVIGEMVFRYKYQGEHHLAGELASYWVELLCEHSELPRLQSVIPIPPSIKRDFDHVAHLAQAFAVRLGIQVKLDTLIKTRLTDPQKELKSLAAKQRNVAGAFILQGKVAGQNLLLVDDMYDSGATLCEAARTLARGRPANIVVLTLTKTIHADR